MTLSDLRKLSDADLSNQCTFIATTISGSPSTYFLTAPQASSLEDAATLFATSVADLPAARATFETALETKDGLRASTLELFGQLLNLVYAQPAVTPEILTTLDLTPRSTSKTPVVPVTPTTLVALPNVDGTVKVSWKPNGNKYGVVYELEVSDMDESNWAVVASVTKKSVTLEGFEPGVPKFFRVRATKNGEESPWSLVEGIYLPQPGVSLSIAA